MGTDAAMPRSADPQGYCSNAMDDCLAVNQSWHDVSWVQSLELRMPRPRDRPKEALASSQKTRKRLSERDIQRR